VNGFYSENGDGGDPCFFLSGVGANACLRQHKGINLFMNEYVDKVSNLLKCWKVSN